MGLRGLALITSGLPVSASKNVGLAVYESGVARWNVEEAWEDRVEQAGHEGFLKSLEEDAKSIT